MIICNEPPVRVSVINDRRVKAAWDRPVDEMFGISPHLEHECARRIEGARNRHLVLHVITG